MLLLLLLLLVPLTVVVDVQCGEYRHGSLHSGLLLQPLVEVEGPEELDHLPQLDGLGFVLVVHLEDPVEFVWWTASGRTVGGDDEFVEVDPAILVLPIRL